MGVMNNSSIKLTIEIGTAGIDVKASPLSEMFLRILQERLQELVTPEFIAFCLYQAAKKLPATPRRKKAPPPAAPASSAPVITSKPTSAAQ